MTDLIIVAAGNGTRMGGVSVPKILYPILGSTNLERTYGFAKDIFEKIYVICRNQDRDIFHEFCKDKDFEKLELIFIDSGFGDGHAIFTGLKTINLETEVVLMWGDAVLMNGDILKELVEKERTGSIIFPVRKEEDPYVWFDNDNMVVKATYFSKKSETIEEGYHDQSMFRGNALQIGGALSLMHMVQNRNGMYLTFELNFLHIMHLFYNMDRPATMYETDYQVFGFNTVLEAKNIEKILN